MHIRKVERIMSKTLNETSKFLSYVLRHEPQAIGLTLDSEGWADIAALMECAAQSGRAMALDLIQQVVDTSDKKRFSLSADGLRIRAAQGHSTGRVAITYPEKEPPEWLFHGTATRFLDSILKEGLRPGERHHVHLSEDEQTAAAVGQRYGKPVVLRVEARWMRQQGFRFFQADNGVWLTEAVPVQFIMKGAT